MVFPDKLGACPFYYKTIDTKLSYSANYTTASQKLAVGLSPSSLQLVFLF